MPPVIIQNILLSVIRIVAGIGNGMNTATAPVWASETSKTEYRGKTGMALMVINIGGLAISCWMTCKSLIKDNASRRLIRVQMHSASSSPRLGGALLSPSSFPSFSSSFPLFSGCQNRLDGLL